jgi:hypothetical protein
MEDSELLSEIRSILVDEAMAIRLIRDMICILKSRQSDQPSTGYWEAIQRRYDYAMQIIYSQSESPIEKMLLSSVTICFLMTEPFLLVVTPPFKDFYMGKANEERLLDLYLSLDISYGQEVKDFETEKARVYGVAPPYLGGCLRIDNNRTVN